MQGMDSRSLGEVWGYWYKVIAVTRTANQVLWSEKDVRLRVIHAHLHADIHRAGLCGKGD